MDKCYTYWFFLVKSEYIKRLPVADKNLKLELYAYTDKKILAALFLKTHRKDAFVIKKKKISREDVNLLTKKFQNLIIRKVSVRTKDSNYNIINMDIGISENEGILSESQLYAVIDQLFKYAWDSNLALKKEYKNALDILGYTKIHNAYMNGEPLVVPSSFIEEDLFGSLIELYGPVMEVNI